MRMEKVCFRQDVIVEPLYDQWYAWSYLISPATAAMYIANSHLKKMQSFVSAPQMHVAALKNPAMLGGPFIDHDPSRADEIKVLVERTTREQARMLKFAAAVQELDNLLATEAAGFSLEPLYQKVPDVLKGYVELLYDLNNQPSMRFIEGLLYKSEYYNTAAQSIELSIANGNSRSFVFSTPRLQSEGHLRLNMPFNYEGFDELFKMKYVPQPYDYIKELLHIRDEDDEVFRSFFTEEIPPPHVGYAGDDVRVRYFGHACLLIESKDTSILCDPVISYKQDIGRDYYTYTDLPDSIDYALITHNHQDHCMFETLLQLRHKIKHVIVPKNNGGSLPDPSLKFVLQNIGFKNVVEIDEVETIEVAGGGITGVPFFGEHGDINVRSKIAYLINLKGRTVMCAADSNNIEPKLYENLRRLIEKIDVLFVGMECDGAPLTWLYGPLLTRPVARKIEQSRRFNGSDYEKAIDIVNNLNPQQVYVYAMGQEPWLKYLTSIQYTDESHPIVESNKLVASCKSKGIESERLYCQKEIVLPGKPVTSHLAAAF
jgi:L-ascorbate metabolism protein UlaG (beta-lactamase superfamily)